MKRKIVKKINRRYRLPRILSVKFGNEPKSPCNVTTDLRFMPHRLAIAPIRPWPAEKGKPSSGTRVRVLCYAENLRRNDRGRGVSRFTCYLYCRLRRYVNIGNV